MVNCEISKFNIKLYILFRKHIHKELMKYSELVHWLKAMDPKSFVTLQVRFIELTRFMQMSLYTSYFAGNIPPEFVQALRKGREEVL